ncbi:tyrosine-type recombinase/integrase [Nitrobacter sp. TKz-YC02]|uniref:tyrosine-type recombinase/integrase n=1 Tax=Nitrobacter sp. TKz-YC02 TaxID=3398704 RepID=UPI003CE923F0
MLYLTDKESVVADADRLKISVKNLNEFFGEKKLADINTSLCAAYTGKRGKSGGARRDLETLRAAIRHHSAEGLHRGIVRVTMPKKGERRERWLTRGEVAKLLWICWRHREVQTLHKGGRKGETTATKRFTLRHIARFILIGVYTGTRATALASASAIQEKGRSFVDLERGIFYRQIVGTRITNKKQPPVPLPPRLLSHLRRWHRADAVKAEAKGKTAADLPFIHWNGKPVASVKKGFARAVDLAELPGSVTPHTLRHTAATWAMQNGIPIWEAAGYLGMSPEVLNEHYAHHSPDHLRGAASAIVGKASTTGKPPKPTGTGRAVSQPNDVDRTQTTTKNHREHDQSVAETVVENGT